MAHSTCLSKADSQAQEEAQETRRQPKNLGRGFAGALLGALVGVIPWIVAYHFGWFVAVLGLVIALASKKGYELMGGKPSKLKLWFVMLSVIFAVLFSFVALFSYYVAADGMPLQYLPELVLPYVLSAEFWVDVLPDTAMGILFAGLGCIGLVGELRREAKGPAGRIELLDSRQTADIG